MESQAEQVEPVLPKKGSTIFVRWKEPWESTSDLWYMYKYLNRGTKASGKHKFNPWMNVEDSKTGERLGFWHSDVEWMYGNHSLAPESIHNYVKLDDQLPVNPKLIAEEDISHAYVTFIPRKYWNHPFVREAKEAEIRNFQKFNTYTWVRHTPHIGSRR